MSYNLVDKVVNGKVMVDQGIGSCSGGTYENVCAVTDIIKGKRLVQADSISVYILQASLCIMSWLTMVIFLN